MKRKNMKNWFKCPFPEAKDFKNRRKSIVKSLNIYRRAIKFAQMKGERNIVRFPNADPKILVRFLKRKGYEVYYDPVAEKLKISW